MDVINTIEEILREQLRREGFRGYSLVTVRDHIVCIHGGYKACIYWADYEEKPRWSLDLAWPHSDSYHHPDTTGNSHHEFDIYTVDPDRLVELVINHLGGIHRRSTVVRL